MVSRWRLETADEVAYRGGRPGRWWRAEPGPGRCATKPHNLARAEANREDGHPVEWKTERPDGWRAASVAQPQHRIAREGFDAC
jgi:hypothetical protein